jgi:hypothetical protein
MDGVLIVESSQSIGFDHLVLDGNGIHGGSGISDGGDHSSSFISVSQLDVSNESASPPISLDAAKHVSYNDLGSGRGYYTSAGANVTTGAAAVPGVTIGQDGSSFPTALRIGSVGGESLYSVLGTTPASGADNVLNGIYGVLLAIWNALAGSSSTPLVATDQSGNLAIAGGFYLPGPSGNAVVISSGASTPTSSTPGHNVAGSMYIYYNATGVTHKWYVSTGSSWVGVTGS